MLYYIPLILKIWMLIDAAQRRADVYWFFIILMVPFGEFAYFFLVKINDFGHARNALSKQLSFTRRASIDQLRYNLKHAPSAVNQIALAAALYDRKELAEAAEIFSAVLETHPDEKPALHGLGLAQVGLGDDAAAIDTFERLLELDRSYLGYSAWHEYASALWRTGKKEQAIESLRALAAKNTRIEHRTALADYLMQVGRKEEAANLLREVIEEYSHSPRYIQRADRGGHRRAKQLLKSLDKA